eukprot:1769771-Pleurochrysis_carterae.AAC.1
MSTSLLWFHPIAPFFLIPGSMDYGYLLRCCVRFVASCIIFLKITNKIFKPSAYKCRAVGSTWDAR